MKTRKVDTGRLKSFCFILPHCLSMTALLIAWQCLPGPSAQLKVSGFLAKASPLRLWVLFVPLRSATSPHWCARATNPVQVSETSLRPVLLPCYLEESHCGAAASGIRHARIDTWSRAHACTWITSSGGRTMHMISLCSLMGHVSSYMQIKKQNNITPFTGCRNRWT